MTFAIVTLNTSAQLYIAFHPHNATNPAAYTGAEWYTPAFRAELRAAGNPAVWNDGGWWEVSDLHLPDFNATGGIRATSNTPAQYDHTVYLFGDSVMFGFTVPDRYTIASQLQAMLPNTRVVNLGVPDTTTNLAYNRLLTLPLRPGDTVIYYGGASETRGVFYAAQREVQNWPLVQLCTSATLAIAQALCWNANDTVNLPLLTDTRRLSVVLDSLQADYIKYVRKMQTFAQTRGVTFVSVLEPYLWSMTLSEHEQGIWIDANLRYADIKARPYEQTANLTVGGLDFTHVLDNERQRGTELYTDLIHLNAAGNYSVARAIYAAIWQTF